MSNKSTLFDTVKAIAEANGDNQGKLSKKIQVNNSFFWYSLDRESVQFDALLKAVELYGSKIIIRSRRQPKLFYSIDSETKLLFKAIKHLAFDCGMSQRDLSFETNRDSGTFWKRLKTQKIRYTFLKEACEEIEADIIISVDKVEHIINPKIK